MTKRWKRALVTGASSGIGRDLCRELAADGTDLVVVARDERRLDALADELDVDVEVLVADLSRRADIDRVAARLADDEVPVDLLVNNAGFGKGGPLVENDMDVAVDVVTVNATAVMVLSHAAAVALVRRGGGGIVNVSSMAGELVAPNSAVYSATKAFVTSFSESLHQELKPLGVTVTAALPGFTDTIFAPAAPDSCM